MSSFALRCREEAWAELSGYPAWDWDKPPADTLSQAGSAAAGRRRSVAVEADLGPLDPDRPWIAAADRAFQYVETPFTWARRATIPLVSAEHYSRAWFLTSLACTPPAVALYFRLPLQAVAVLALIGGGLASLAAAATRGRGGVAPAWDCGLRVPLGALVLALVGFAVACMWINTIANELLGLLQLLGILCHVSDMVR